MECTKCKSLMKRHYSVSRFNQKLICPKCDLSDALFEDRLNHISKTVISNAIRTRSFADKLDFLVSSI